MHAVVGHIQRCVFSEPLGAFAACNTSPEEITSTHMPLVGRHDCGLVIKRIVIGIGFEGGPIIFELTPAQA